MSIRRLALAAASMAAFSCSVARAQDQPEPQAPPSAEAGSEPADQPEPAPSVRVGGVSDETVETVERSWGTEYRSGRSRVVTPLPVGYPAPTAPGVMEIKHYPSVRRAEINAQGREDGMMGWNTSRAFWPLFQHIKDRDIAMTAPVETDYAGVTADGEVRDAEWSMSFLYREPSLGDTGHDGAVFVYDAEPITVVSVGVRGDLSRQELRRAVSELYKWASVSEEWESAGGARKLSYNGPDVAARDRWHEVQLPIRKRATAEPPANPADGAGAAPNSSPETPEESAGPE